MSGSLTRTIETQTKDYWQLSSTIMGRSKAKITVEAALAQVNDLEHHLGPHRCLRRSVRHLSVTIIEGKRIKKPCPATITRLSSIIIADVIAGGSK